MNAWMSAGLGFSMACILATWVLRFVLKNRQIYLVLAYTALITGFVAVREITKTETIPAWCLLILDQTWLPGVLLGLAMVAILRLTQITFRTRINAPTLHNVSFAFMILAALTFITAFLTSRMDANDADIYYSVMLGSYCVVLGHTILVAFARSHHIAGAAWLTVFSSSIMLLAVVLHALIIQGLVAESVYTEYGLIIGLVISALFLPLAFADAITFDRRRLREEAEIAREEAHRREEKQRFKEATDHAHKVRVLNREKQLEAELRQRIAERGEALRLAKEASDRAKEAAEEASKTKATFIAFMSHEIRTPLNGIIGMARMMLGTDLDEQQQEYIDALNYAGEALLSLVNDVLDLSKMEAGRMELEEVPFELSRLVDSIVMMMTARAEEKGLYFRSDMPDNLPRMIKGDPTRFRQILLNLSTNAIKFTGKGGITMRVRMPDLKGGTVPTKGKIRFRFEVEDTGIGIPEESRSKIFGEFQQASTSTSRQFGGTGLGLNICKKLVKAMDGEIGFDTKEGKGTTFWFNVDLDAAPKDSKAVDVAGPAIPGRKKAEAVIKAAAKDAVKEKAHAAATAPVPGEIPPLHVLVVEDDFISQQVVAGYLKNENHTAEAVGDGKSAIDAVRNKDFDLVLMDCGLPDMTGHDATRAIRKLDDDWKKAIPIIAATGNVAKDDIDDCLKAGMNDFVGKPIDPDQLYQAIERIWTAFKERLTKGRAEETGKDEGGAPKAAPEKKKPEPIAAPPEKEAPKVAPTEEKKKPAPKAAPAIEPKKAKPEISSADKLADEAFKAADMRSLDRSQMQAEEAVREHDVTESIEPVVWQTPTTFGASGEGTMVLVIEDDSISQKLITGYLTNDGHVVHVVPDGESGIEAIIKGGYEVVLMDINLPGISGLEATRQIRSNEDEDIARTPIIAVTGNVEPEDIEACREVGMNDFIGKPVDPDYLRSAILRVRKAAKYMREGDDIPDDEFTVYLPEEADEEEAEGEPNVLVIEDDPISQQLVGGYLKNDGHIAMIVGDGESGVAAAKEKTFDAVLMDIDLPGISGLEATRQIRAMPGKTKSRVPIIAITGNVTQDDIEACRKAGMNDFVGKPIDPDYLRSAIMRVKRSGENVIGDIDDPNIAIYLEPHTLTHLQRNFQPDVLKNLIDQFKTKSAEVIGELDAFVANEDRKAIKSKAHMLKGMSRNLALDLMGQLCADIEINALEGDLDEIGDMVSMLQPTLEESSQALGVWYDAVVEGG